MLQILSGLRMRRVEQSGASLVPARCQAQLIRWTSTCKDKRQIWSLPFLSAVT